MFTVILQIAKNTLRESLREPVYLLMLMTTLVLMGIFPVFTLFVFSAQEKLITDSSMATTMLFGWGTAILVSSYAISREIDNGTALLLLSKPVQRPAFIIAKILGIMASSLIFCFLATLGSLISLRIAADEFRMDMVVMSIYFGALVIALLAAAIHNYLNQSSFPMATVFALMITLPVATIFAHFLPYEGAHVGLNSGLFSGLVLVGLSVLVMGCLATTLSTRCGLVSNLLICFVLFLLGLMTDYLIGRHTWEAWHDTPPAGKEALWISYYSFAPTELFNVGKWDTPAKIDDGEAFVVWTGKEKPRHLPSLGADPASVWNDSEDWKNNIEDVGMPITQLARYDAELQKWDVLVVANEAQLSAEKNQEMQSKHQASYTSYVFRRSNNRPRTPRGGTFLSPKPSSGSVFASVLYVIIPNWQLFWMADAISNHTTIPVFYIVLAAFYTLIIIGILMIIAVSLFQNREVGTQVAN